MILGCAVSTQGGADESLDSYSAMPAVDCVINPYRVADIASPVAGVIEGLYVERSQQVSEGQVVAQLEAGVEAANVELAKFRAGIQSEIKLGQVSLDFDERRKQRFEQLHQKKVISIENTDEAEREADLSRWKLKQAKELSDIRKLELRRAEEQLKQKSIKAPFDGFVLDTFKYHGEYVEDQAILRVAQLDPLVVEAIVPMEHFGLIKAGMLAEIVPEVMSGEKVKAKVTIVDRIGDTASNTFGVKLVLPNPENRIPAGLKCVVKFLEPTAEQTLAMNEIPVEKPQPQINSDEQKYVADHDTVTENENTVASVDVEELKESTGLIDREPLDEDDDGELMVASVEMDSDPDPVMEPEPSSYLVLTDQAETNEQTRELIKQLREMGVSDLQEMDRGPYRGRIILGLYSTLGAAKRRQQALEQQGFSPFIRERY